MKKEKTSILKAFRKLAKTTRWIISGVIMGVLLITILCMIIFAPKGGTSFSSRSSLKEILESSDLTTAEYTYNSYVAVKEGGSEEIKYYVAYDGTVRAGFELDKIEIEQEGTKVTITIPVINIQSVAIDTGSMDYIFLAEKYNTENTFQEALNACKVDLKDKAENNETFRKTAYQGAEETIKALTRLFDSQYEISIVFADDIMEEEAQ